MITSLPPLSFLGAIAASFMLVPSCNANTISATTMEVVMEAADVSNRVYLFKSTDYFKPNESYYESADNQDAALLAVYDDQCIVGFRGTKPITTTEVDGPIPDITIAGIIDTLVNADRVIKKDVESKTNPSTKCSVGNGFYNAYFCDFYANLEAQIDQDCVAQGKPLIFTGHSQGAALAQIAALRYEAQEPQVTVFAPAPTFFDECEAVPHERITNFVNTEEEIGGGSTPVQYDVVPFVDTFVENMIDELANFIGWGLPQSVVDSIVDTVAGGFANFYVGSYKGEYYILSPNYHPSATYKSRRADITGVTVDIVDWQEFFNPDITSYSEQLFTSHMMDVYQEKLTILHDASRQLVADGFEIGGWCNHGHDFMCTDFCTNAEPVSLCSSGARDEACGKNDDCDSGLYCGDDWTCVPTKGWMGSCDEDSDCSSGWCFLWRCGL